MHSAQYANVEGIMDQVSFAVKLLIIVIISSPMACGEKKSESVGPYTISFDLGGLQGYTIQNYTQENNTYKTYDLKKFNVYSLVINTSQNFALINVADFGENKMDNSMYQCQKYLEKYMTCLGFDVDPKPDKTVGGYKGILYEGDNSTTGDKIFAIEYWTHLNTLDVLIISDFPWPQETSKLIESIRVEGNNQYGE